MWVSAGGEESSSSRYEFINCRRNPRIRQITGTTCFKTHHQVLNRLGTNDQEQITESQGVFPQTLSPAGFSGTRGTSCVLRREAAGPRAHQNRQSR